MDQGGFDFQKPSERREARRFEPPPWEQEAFDALKRKREEAEALEARQVAEAAPVAEEAVRPPVAVAPNHEATMPPGQSAELAASASSQVEEAHKKGEIDEARVIELMAGLAGETQRSRSMAMTVTLVVGGFLTVLGAGLTVWGVIQTVKAQGAGRTLSMMLVVMGLAYAAVGVSLGYRALKERGVL